MAERIKSLYSKWAPIYEFAHHLQTLWRDSHYRKMVAQAAEIKEDDYVLDVGCGTGLTGLEVLAKQPQAHVVGTDLTYSMIKKGLKNISEYPGKIDFVNGDMQQLPFRNNSFDAVISTYGIGGIEDKQKTMEEIVRVAKPGASISAVEMSSPPQEMKFKNLLHNYVTAPTIDKLWGFEDTELASLYEKNGIEIEGNKYLDELIFGSSRLVYGRIRK